MWDVRAQPLFRHGNTALLEALANLEGVRCRWIRAQEEALKGDISKGDIRKWDFAVKLALNISSLTALAEATPQGKRRPAQLGVFSSLFSSYALYM